MAVRVGVARYETVLAEIDGGRREPGGHVIVVEEWGRCRGGHGRGGRDNGHLTGQEDRGSRIGDVEHGERETLNKGIEILECGASS